MTTSSLTTRIDLPAVPLSKRRLRVAVIDEEIPFPPNSGKRIRTLNLIRRLAQRHEVTYLCHRNTNSDEVTAGRSYLAAHDIGTVVVPRTTPPKSGVGFYARLAANLFSPLPYSVASHMSSELREAIEHHAATRDVDLWHCEWTPYAELLRGVPGPKLVVAHNVESVIWQRYRDTELNPLKRWYIGHQCRKFEQFERRTLAEVDRTVAVSDVDATRLRDDFGVKRVEVVDNGVDMAYFQPTNRRRMPGRMLFLGSLDWRPNLDGVTLLLDEIFPAVQTSVPTASLAIVGRNPPRWLTQRVSAAVGVTLHADVPDVRPFLADCSLMVVPLRVGGGSRLKILEALAAGVPVVSTRVGAEGLCLESGRDITVVDRIEDLAAALIAAVDAPETMALQAESGRELVLERHDWDRLAEQLERIWLDTASVTSER